MTPQHHSDLLAAPYLAKSDRKTRCNELIAALPAMDFSSDAAIEAGIKSLAESNGLRFRDYQSAARLAVTGRNEGPHLTGILRVLGRERVMKRMLVNQAMEAQRSLMLRKISQSFQPQ